MKTTIMTVLAIVLLACPFVLAANSDAQVTSEANVLCPSDPNEIEHGE